MISKSGCIHGGLIQENHNVIMPTLSFVDKTKFYTPFRHALAALHFNFNLNCDVKRSDDGSVQLAVHYPKFKNGEATIKDIRVQQNFGKFINIYCPPIG